MSFSWIKGNHIHLCTNEPFTPQAATQNLNNSPIHKFSFIPVTLFFSPKFLHQHNFFISLDTSVPPEYCWNRANLLGVKRNCISDISKLLFIGKSWSVEMVHCFISYQILGVWQVKVQDNTFLWPNISPSKPQKFQTYKIQFIHCCTYFNKIPKGKKEPTIRSMFSNLDLFADRWSTILMLN